MRVIKNQSVCNYHVTYTFQSESTLYSCLNLKELLARKRRDDWSLSDTTGIWTHNHLVRKWTLNHLAELAKRLSCKYLFVRCIWLYVIIVSCTRFRVNLHLSECQESPFLKQGWYPKIKWQQRDSNRKPLSS